MKAYCWSSGWIEFGKAVPEGAIIIASGREKPLRAFIEQVARHGYQTVNVAGRAIKVAGTEHLLVPGVPEAANDMAKVDALTAFKSWIRSHRPKGVTI